TSSASMVMTTLATPKAAPRAWAEFFKGMPEGAKTAWDIMKTGFSAEEFMDFKPSGDSYIALTVKTPFTELMKNNDYAGTLTKMMFTMPHYMIRTYRAWDALLKAGNKRFHGYMIEYNKDFGTAAGQAYDVYAKGVEAQLQQQADDDIAKLK